LKPGTTYRYRVVSREFVEYEQQHIVKWGETVAGQSHEFTTLDREKKQFSFCVVADHHEREEELKAMMKEDSWKGIEFAVYNGDIIGDFMSRDQVFTSFIDASVEAFATHTPFIFVRGNHDIRGRYARDLADFIPSFDGCAYFSFNHGPVHFIVLDTGEDKEDGHEYYNGLVDCDNYLKEEARWLARDLDSPACRDATHRIVFCHIPLLPGGGHATVRAHKNFDRLFNAANVDLVLSGHFHRLGHVPPAEGKNVYHQVIAPNHATSRVVITKEGIDLTITQVGGKVLKKLSIPRR
jgi:predicted phosphodiesterase